MKTRVFDDRACTLGEGPLWHPLRKQLFWFDIMERKLMTRDATGPQEWSFDDYVSAAGWVDEHSLLIASASALWRFDLSNGTRTRICPLEAENPTTRSNDGRADPWGGFWIGTMGLNAETGAGAIYRYYQGTLRKLFAEITISNAICFAPDRSTAYFTDTARGQVMKVALDREGWPTGEPAVFVDLRSDGLNPDGALVDAEGNLWIAQWGTSQVAGYSPEGAFIDAIPLPARHVTCPAFGGADFGSMFVTSAKQGLPEDIIAGSPQQGMTFVIGGVTRGVAEPRVLL
ncbi:MAG: SMP-30/gluconolactonase/LRE family protein [Pseudomonadota bacterium]